MVGGNDGISGGVYLLCRLLFWAPDLYSKSQSFWLKDQHVSLKKWTNFLEKILVSKGHSQGDILKVLWAMVVFYVFHGDHFKKQSSVGYINPVLGPVVMFCFWVSLITFQSHLVCVSDVAVSRLDKGLPVYSPVCPGQCTGVSWTNIRLGTGSFAG